ncbi:peptide ABC transporter substrate-binding protein [Sphaerisporangium siamense]|uniref:Peptide/nickel transport system substrate-binding protein n=1 Tax=Sphaerisporangium siamense TaxID=795645 RepID=A0A7W7D3U8_9ACTN|nr:ABC transporter substrate-binding protein [Sphaerisporangium siamense]MBB4699824.1 peptide/nickel transport system substrate-binding protein [Sphaerisporangium siamense]GII84856.1 peptide ABC transporter substrate-binding protein [Sphaerisporangium siamense]
MSRSPGSRRYALSISALVTICLLAVAGCTGQGTAARPTGGQGPVRGGNLNVAIPNDPGSLDFVAKPNLLAAHMGDMIFEKLFEVDKNYEARPMLVDAYERSEDGLTYTFTLRKDVTFHDGTPLTSKDVVASMKRWLTGNATGKLVAKQVDDVKAADEHTVRFLLSKPRYGLIKELTTSSAAIYQAKSLEGVGANGLTTPQIIGTGPYRLKSWNVGQKIIFERYDKYVSRGEEDWGGQAGAKHAYLDTITYLVVSDEDALVNGLKAGRWDYAMPSNEKYETLKSDPSLTVATWSSGNVNFILPNRNPASVFHDVRARQGLNLILNKPELNAVGGGGQDITALTGSFAMPANKGMHSTVGADRFQAHDPAQGKKLLEQAGLKPGQVLRIVTTKAYPQLAQWAVVIQQELQEVGVEAKIETYDFTAMLATTMTRPTEWDISMMMYNGSMTTPAQFALMQGFDEQGQAKIAAYDRAADEAGAKAAVDDLQTYIWDQLPGIAISQSKFYAAYTARLRGYDDFYRIFWNAWITR